MLVPFAGSPPGGSPEALAGLQLPNLQRLLARLREDGADTGAPDSLSMPHERALARAWGLETATDGLIPLAAWQARQDGLEGAEGAGWAWITPSHWRVGRDHVEMAPAAALALDGVDSRTLLSAMEPYFAEDGITLHYQAPLRWLARGELFRKLPTASLDRVGGRTIDGWMPAGAPGRPLRRLQQEMQMLLYTLPLNDARQRGGLLPVNSFWASGSGALPANVAEGAATPPAGLRLPQSLREAALQGDPAAWRAAWQQLDARECAQLLEELDAGRPVRLTLCGDAHARSWVSGSAGAWQRFTALFSRPAPAALLGAL
ncbi:phosphoglycerate mutase [Ramlibacter sp. XY19]|uniref:phosphoglycerate mutase n=1 Tax=Ramlibacter paludis TaxID=2908000 RepID=UPI0023DB9434|nr:phosphoglycerate mutase [Ramlibacter paludis]MCG2591954.1 phosphoglycerate mutase [Ramlibacter paludis]